MMMHSSALAAYAQYTLAESFIPELPDRYRGKVRENYDLRDGTRILIATDRISAFDWVLPTGRGATVVIGRGGCTGHGERTASGATGGAKFRQYGDRNRRNGAGRG